MTHFVPSSILSLPDEVIQAIFSCSSPYQIPTLQLVCKRFANIANEQLLWRQYCIDTFKWWHKGHQFHDRLQDPSSTDWRELFASRHRVSTETASALRGLIGSENGRLKHIQRILDGGYDAKEVLLKTFHNAKDSDQYLAQRYWSHAALGCLHRTLAVEEWLSLKYRDEAPDATERSFGALDLFVLGERTEGDIDQIFSRLETYVSAIRTAHPAIDSQTPRQKAITIAEQLLANQWIGIQDDRHYHSLDHLFLGVSLFSTNRNSVPLISAVIYSYVARQFGLSASPISYPFHVHVYVQAPAGLDLDGNPYTPSTDSSSGPGPSEANTMYMNPFTQSEPVAHALLQRQLNFIAPRSTPQQQATYLSPSPPRDLTIRAAHNILAAPQHFSGPPLFPVSSQAASYAALFALVILPEAQHPAQLRQHLAVLAQHFLEHFELDVSLFETHVFPLTTSLPDGHAYRGLLRNIRESDAAHRPPKPRIDKDTGLETENAVVAFRVGQVFRHRRRGYLAVIYGWDAYCRMQEDWIDMNQVDRLSRGRSQPFYNVLVSDESTRYVAEENVVLIPSNELPSEEELVDSFPIEIGKWFTRFDGERGVFVRDIGEDGRGDGEYPDD